jgi:CheY-like chemotaxis protein
MPDLLFTDIVMPGGINGFELVRRLREYWPHLKVLMMSGYPGTAASANNQMDGTHMLGKPFHRGELAAKVRQALDEPFSRVDEGSAAPLSERLSGYRVA